MAIFVHYFGAVLPAHPVSRVLSGLSLIQALQPPNFPDASPLSCFYFDSQLNPVSYFYNLLGTLALFSLNGEVTWRGDKEHLLAGTPLPVTVLLHMPGTTAFPVTGSKATPQKKAFIKMWWLDAQETSILTKGSCPVPRGQRKQAAWRGCRHAKESQSIPA